MRRFPFLVLTVLCAVQVTAQTISTKDHSQQDRLKDDPARVIIIIDEPTDDPQGRLAQRIAAREQLTDVPTLYLNTVGNEGIDEADEEKTATIRIVDEYGSLTEMTQEGITLAGWGHQTWDKTQKHSYRITLNEAHDMVNLDGSSAEKTWVLKAHAGDKSFLRQALAYDLSNAVGLPFAPRYRFVDLVLNETLMGTYQLTDDIDVATTRVNVNSAKGWLLDMTTAEGVATNDTYLEPDGQTPLLRIINPNPTDIKLATKNQMKTFVSEMWEATSIRPYIDVTSFVNWHIASEILGCYDTFGHVYVYREDNAAQLMFGPLGDSELACDNSYAQNMTAEWLMADTYIKNTADGLLVNAAKASAWKTKMKTVVKQPWFVEAVQARWTQLIGGGLEERLTQYIDVVAATLQYTQTLNFMATQDGGAGWDIGDNAVTGVTHDGYFMFSNHYAAVQQVKDYLAERFDYLQVKIPAMKAEYIPGDVNGDMVVDINDVMAMVAFICQDNPTPFNVGAADANTDGDIDINDVMWIVDAIVQNAE